jgi:hypothetical protein
MSLNNSSLKRFFQRYRAAKDAIISHRLTAYAYTFARIRQIGEQTATVRFEEFRRRFDNLRPGFLNVRQAYLEVLKREAPAYNIFYLFDLKDDENIHSDFISGLLDPHGSHGQGSLFLETFLNLIRDKGAALPEKLGHITVRREKPSEDAKGRKGRIDISIEIPGAESFCLVVENKIWSGAHGLQLERYYEDVKKRYRKVILVYLTPYGRPPEAEAMTPALRVKLRREEVLFALSYIGDVVEWLTAALKEVEAEHLRGTLRMYIDVLEKWQSRGV